MSTSKQELDVCGSCLHSTDASKKSGKSGNPKNSTFSLGIMVPDYEALEDQIVIGDCEIKATKNTFTTKHCLIVAKQGLKAAKTKWKHNFTFFSCFLHFV